jgi:phenylacetic acid degradation operon negative regulatory protein
MSPGATAQRPPRLLLTLLGDYWWQRTEPLPSAAIVALLAEFGVSDSAARAALSRLTRNGLLVTSKSGRRTFSRLSSRAAAILDDGARRIFSFGAANQPWDGMWSLVAFSIPEDNRAARDALRKQLRWLGFAPLYDGLWLSPRDHAAEVIGYLKDLDITTGTAFRATSVPVECDIPARAWDLDGLRGRYEGFIDFARQLRDTTAAGQVPPIDALIARTRVMDEWRAFPGLDPDLPAELLPTAWPRAQARELFIGCYDLLGPLAARRVRQIITRYSPDLAERAAYHSSELKLSAAPDPSSALGFPAWGLRACGLAAWGLGLGLGADDRPGLRGAMNLDLLGYLREQGDAAVRGQGLGAQVVHDLHVMVDVLASVQVQRAGQVLDVHDVRDFGLGEAQDGERAARGGVTATGERDDLDRDPRQAGDLDEVGQLLAHHLAAAHRAPQHGLVHDRPHLRRLRAGEQVLALESHADSPVDLLGRRGLVAEQGDRAGVGLGLEQAVDELQLEGTDDRGGALHAQVRLKPVGQDVVVLRPPARGAGLLGVTAQPGPDLLIIDAVHGEQVIHIPDLEPDPAVLHPADLGARRPDLIGRLLRRYAGRLAESAQLAAEHHAQHGRSPWLAFASGRRLAAWPSHAHPHSRA